MCSPLFQSLVVEVKSIIVKFNLAVNLSGMTVICLFLAQVLALATSRVWLTAGSGMLWWVFSSCICPHADEVVSGKVTGSSVSLGETSHCDHWQIKHTFPCQNIILDDFFIHLLHDIF